MGFVLFTNLKICARLSQHRSYCKRVVPELYQFRDKLVSILSRGAKTKFTQLPHLIIARLGFLALNVMNELYVLNSRINYTA